MRTISPSPSWTSCRRSKATRWSSRRSLARRILDLSPEGAAALIRTTQKVATAVKKAFAAPGIMLVQLNGAAAGQSIPHIHFHILPRSEGAGPQAPRPRRWSKPEILEPIAAKIRRGPLTRRNPPYIWLTMIYLLAFFCSPLALLLTGKPISALFNLILYVLSIVFWITIIFHHIGFLLWAIGVLHAVLAINHAREEARARRIIAASRPD